MIAALGDLQVSKVSWRELDSLRGHQVRKRIVRLGQMIMHGTHYLICRVRSSYGENSGMRLHYNVALGSQTAGDDDFSIFSECLADGIKRFFDRRIDEATGIYNYQIRIPIAA